MRPVPTDPARERRTPALACLPQRGGILAMLTILGHKQRFCDGVSRRGFLKIGAFGLGAVSLGLTDILRAETRAGVTSSNKSVINVFLAGGPPHRHMWESKTEAPND